MLLLATFGTILWDKIDILEQNDNKMKNERIISYSLAFNLHNRSYIKGGWSAEETLAQTNAGMQARVLELTIASSVNHPDMYRIPPARAMHVYFTLILFIAKF